LTDYADGKIRPFKFIIEDPSGNSFVQNPSAPTADQYCKMTKYIRTPEDYKFMGYSNDQSEVAAQNDQVRLSETTNKEAPKLNNGQK